VDRVEVPLPALDEQRCIAAILDQTEHLRETRRETLSLLDRLAQAVFVEMFGDPVTNSVGWPRRPIEQIGSVTTSNNPPRANIDSTVPT
jgi:type I restriction enzyme S subunit